MASRLQEYLLQQPLYGAGERAAEAGTSMAPVRSPWEGLARALQGGIGGAMQGYAIGQARGAQKKDNEALAAYMKSPDDPALAAAAADHPSFPTVSLSRMNAKERMAAAIEMQKQREADKENNIRLVASLRQGHADPTVAANAHADAQIRVNEAKRAAEQADREKRFLSATEGLPGDGRPPPAASASPGPMSNGAMPAPNPALPPMRIVPQGPMPPVDQKAEVAPDGLPPTQLTQAIGDNNLPIGQGDGNGIGDASLTTGGPNVDLSNRIPYKGYQVSAARLAAVNAARAAKNEDLYFQKHSEMLKEAEDFAKASAKQYEPITNSMGVRTGQRQLSTGQETYNRNGGPEGIPLSDKARETLVAKGGSAKELDALNQGAPQDVGGYGHKVVGDTINFLKRNTDLIGDPNREAQWWQRYNAIANVDRHQLFGASLTGNEIAAWEAATVNPGMKPSEIKANLSRQAALTKLAASREAHSLAIEGMNDKAIELAVGYKLKDLPNPMSSWDDKEGRILSYTPAAVTGSAVASPPPGVGIPQQAINMLKANPSTRAQFEETFGPGSAAKILGQ